MTEARHTDTAPRDDAMAAPTLLHERKWRGYHCSTPARHGTGETRASPRKKSVRRCRLATAGRGSGEKIERKRGGRGIKTMSINSTTGRCRVGGPGGTVPSFSDSGVARNTTTVTDAGTCGVSTLSQKNDQLITTLLNCQVGSDHDVGTRGGGRPVTRYTRNTIKWPRDPSSTSAVARGVVAGGLAAPAGLLAGACLLAPSRQLASILAAV